MNQKREELGSRLGFLLLAAGCAIGLGNVWRFPFITGQNGGAVFVMFYILFLILLGLPLMMMELAVGRGSRLNLFSACRTLPAGKRFRWHWLGGILISGCAILMMYYTTVSGWLLAYTGKYLFGSDLGSSAEEIGKSFAGFVASPLNCIFYMLLVVLGGALVCGCGLRSGVERITKFLMGGLFLIMLILAFQAFTLPGGSAGYEFYLKPDFSKISLNMLVAALGQAFFTLSVGIGSIEIFGSYIGRENTLGRESVFIIGADTLVALLSGAIIFPVCASYAVDVSSGPGLIFISLPNVFANLAGGRWWGLFFFLFLTIAAFTTIIAVFENLIALIMDEWKWPRWRAALLIGIAIVLLSLPCALGFNLWSMVEPLGAGSNILDLEDYIVSDNLLPLGGIFFVVLCCSRYGWGWNNFYTEVNQGRGWKLPSWCRKYFTYGVPALILGLFVIGILRRWFL
ncbi:MAG: sodium-dependent transporter [Lentisphaeria bacterium]|nr:sodium-dependent transporter [Lentisphaeria bacterium]